MASMTQAGSSWQTALWPADVIHVNEDGWVAINRGLTHGVMVGMRLLVIGAGVREVRDLFNANPNAPESASAEKPVVLRTRRTYELLEVIYVEQESAIAVATRAPLERRPEFYRGPDGELLVWVPLPKDYTWPPPDATDNEATASADNDDNYNYGYGYGYGQSDDSADDDDENEVAGDSAELADDEVDAPNERIAQEDERWEEALPLNGVSVGDRVTPAIPATQGAPITPPTSTAAATEPPPENTPENAHGSSEASGPTYDWLKPLS